MQTLTLPRIALSDGAVEAMKWLGLILMTADHAQKYGMIHAVPGIYEAGRMAFPLFGIVLAYNLVRVQGHDPHVYVRVLTRLLCCGALASIPFIALGGLGFGWWPLNCMGTLAVSVYIMLVSESRLPFWKTRAAAVFLLGGALVEFCWPGVALCVGAWLYIKQPTWRALLLWLAGTAGLTVINGNGWACASFAVLAVMAYGVTMTVGTLGILHYAVQSGMAQQAQTLAFTTFVLFQFFNVFNARVERGTAFNRHFFKNPMLWASLTGVIVLQAVAVHWPPAQAVFGTELLSIRDWGIATGVALSILLLEEGRKLMVALFARVNPRTKTPKLTTRQADS